MAQEIKLKRSAIPGKVPTIGQLELGELANNIVDGKIYFKKSGSLPTIETIFTTNALITGSLYLSGSQFNTGSINVTDNVTAQFFYGDGSNLTNIVATATPAGPDTSIQFRSGSITSGSANFRFDPTNNIVSLTGSMDVSGSIYNIDYIDFSTVLSNPPHLTGRVHWVDDTRTLQVDTDVNNFHIELGHQHVIRVRNISGNPISIGTVVYINGESGNRPTVATASYESDVSSSSTLGLVAQTINDGQNGYVITAGIIRGINTNLYSPGTQLYLGSSGAFTSTPPISPLHEVRLGKVITQATDGIIYVDIMNGYEIGELHDVVDTTTSTTYGNLLVKSGSVWTDTNNLTGSLAIESLTVNGRITSLPTIKSGFVSGSAFTGNPKIYAVTFTTPFTDNNYIINITGEASRTYTVQLKTPNGFTINANANLAFTEAVFWNAQTTGEFN